MRLEGLRLALTTLTVAPVRGPGGVDRRTAGRAMELAPAVGLLLTVVVGGPVYLLRVAGAPPLLAAAMMVAGLALLTRGLHLDGLADTADGLGSARDPAGTRAVMKAPDTGPFGVAAVVLVIAVQVGALTSSLGEHRGTASLGLAVVTGRLAITLACRRTPAASPDGLGAMVAGTVRGPAAAAWCVAVPLLGALGLALDPDATGPVAGRVALGLAAFAAGILTAALLRRHVVRRVGGLTGDVLGFLDEATTTAVLVVLALHPWG